ncbi:MAG: sulfatase-like hydrolase/transferase [Acidobacteria bacterium]|nr:sulfatase-like hydrolase/transferase [Acidobacteriota bacterium]
MKPSRIAAFIGVIACTGLLSCSRVPDRSALRESPPENFLLITLDTLRADRVGCYGYENAMTPNLDRLAAEGVRFEDAVAPAPLTLPSHASLLTGLYPASHGLHTNGRQRLADSVPTLSERLAPHHARRAALVASVSLDSLFGLDRGFTHYDDRMPGAGSQNNILFLGERRGDEMARLAEEWLSDESGPFFLWVHMFDPHAPYDAPGRWRERLSDPYDAEVAFVDEALGQILESLRSRGLLDRTLIVVAGDHGESLGEHGEPTHGIFLYEGAVRVPLVLRYPAVLPAGRVVRSQVRLIDVMPTVLDLFGVAVPDRVEGVSLVDLLLGSDDDPGLDALLETRQPALQFGWSALSALRAGGWKYISAPREELYDLETDPGEVRNLAARELQRVGEMRSRLERIRAGLAPAREAEAVRPEGELRRQLESLGYIGGLSHERSGAAGADPKQQVDLLPRIARASEAFEAREYEEAAGSLEAILVDDPSNIFCRRLLARSMLGMGRVEDGKRQYAKLLERAPADAEALNALGTITLRQGRLGEAEQYLRAAEEVNPWDPRIKNNLAYLQARRGDLDGAEGTMGLLLDENPGFIEAALNLAALQRRRGKSAAAEQTLRKCLEHVPDESSVRRALADLLRELGRGQEADRLLSGASPAPVDPRKGSSQGL